MIWIVKWLQTSSFSQFSLLVQGGWVSCSVITDQLIKRSLTNHNIRVSAVSLSATDMHRLLSKESWSLWAADVWKKSWHTSRTFELAHKNKMAVLNYYVHQKTKQLLSRCVCEHIFFLSVGEIDFACKAPTLTCFSPVLWYNLSRWYNTRLCCATASGRCVSWCVLLPRRQEGSSSLQWAVCCPAVSMCYGFLQHFGSPGVEGGTFCATPASLCYDLSQEVICWDSRDWEIWLWWALEWL